MKSGDASNGISKDKKFVNLGKGFIPREKLYANPLHILSIIPKGLNSLWLGNICSFNQVLTKDYLKPNYSETLFYF